jgi:hypothetical protein
MSDILITANSEFEVFQAEAQTEAGTIFLDAFMPDDTHLVVVDAGRIILPGQAERVLIAQARMAGLTVEREEQI